MQAKEPSVSLVAPRKGNCSQERPTLWGPCGHHTCPQTHTNTTEEGAPPPSGFLISLSTPTLSLCLTWPLLSQTCLAFLDLTLAGSLLSPRTRSKLTLMEHSGHDSSRLWGIHLPPQRGWELVPPKQPPPSFWVFLLVSRVPFPPALSVSFMFYVL